MPETETERDKQLYFFLDKGEKRKERNRQINSGRTRQADSKTTTELSARPEFWELLGYVWVSMLG